MVAGPARREITIWEASKPGAGKLFRQEANGKQCGEKGVFLCYFIWRQGVSERDPRKDVREMERRWSLMQQAGRCEREEPSKNRR